MKILLIPIFFLAFVSVFPQSDNKITLEQLNQSLAVNYKKGEFKQALKIASQILDLSLKVYGENSIETAIAYKNLGAILRDTYKQKDSIEIFLKAATIYEKNGNSDKELALIYGNLANAYYLTDDKQKAEANYLRSIELTEKVWGKESKQAAGAVFAAAKFYAGINDLDKADQFYLRSYELVIKNYGKTSGELEIIDDERACASVGSSERRKKFEQEKERLFGAVTSGVINGKALRLAEPEYPPAARAVKASGSVVVKTRVNEQGNVYEVRALCGHPLLQASAMEAAKKTKFLPALLDGKPIKINGYIVYNFVPR